MEIRDTSPEQNYWLYAPHLNYTNFHLWLSSLQDLKPSNLAVNEDCELKVSEPLLQQQIAFY